MKPIMHLVTPAERVRERRPRPTVSQECAAIFARESRAIFPAVRLYLLDLAKRRTRKVELARMCYDLDLDRDVLLHWLESQGFVTMVSGLRLFGRLLPFWRREWVALS